MRSVLFHKRHIYFIKNRDKKYQLFGSIFNSCKITVGDGMIFDGILLERDKSPFEGSKLEFNTRLKELNFIE